MPRSAPQHEAVVGIGGQAVSQAEGPTRAEGSRVGIAHVVGAFERECGRRAAELEIGDADEERQVGGADENLRVTGVPAGVAAANRIVRGEAVCARTSESRLGAITAGTQSRGAHH
jgi:hypothetical protein